MSEHPLTNLVVPYHDHIRIEFLDAANGEARVRIPDSRELTNHLATVHGGVLFAAGEIAAATAMIGQLGAEVARLRAITRRANIDYLKPARGVITAHAVVGMARAEILAAIESSPSIDVPIAVVLTDAVQRVVARLAVEWFVGRPRG